MKDNIVILGDWISDVYINTTNIKQNQEVINKESYKGYYDEINVYPGGTGFIIDNLLNLIQDSCNYNIYYLLPNFNFENYIDNLFAFNTRELFDRSIKYIYNNHNCENFNIIKMQPIDYLNDVIKPTVKVRFISKRRSEVFYRFDMDNDVQLKNINCNHVFSQSTSKNNSNHLILIDYDKGCFNKDSVKSLFNYIDNNNIKVDNVFLNTKPHKLNMFIPLLDLVKSKNGTVCIQFNEGEFIPVKAEIERSMWWNYIIVTRGTKDIMLYDLFNSVQTKTTFDIKESIVNDVPTTSGCGDIFFANVIYNYLYNKFDMNQSITKTIDVMKQKIINLNHKLFEFE